jgi:hypothetical protein
MKKLTCAAIAVMGVAMAATQASAAELWDPHLRGVDEGLAAGALPPKGLYFVDDNYWATYKIYGAGGAETTTHLDAAVNVPILLWNPGFTVLGASYAAAIAQPFDYTTLTGGQGHIGTFNTVVVPAILSWALPYDFFVKPSIGVYLNDASSSYHHGDTPQGGQVGAGMANTTFEPSVGFSWLHDGWNLSAQLMYDTSTADGSSTKYNAVNPTKVQQGDQIAVDYTATKTLGKWTVGVGGYQLNQLQRDKSNGVSQSGSVAQSYGLGPILGYQFGGVGIQAEYNHAITVHNDVGGDWFNLRFVVPIDLSGVTK